MEESTRSGRITASASHMPVMKSTVEGGRTPTKRTKNEVQTKIIEIEEKVRDRNKFELPMFSVISSVGTALDCY